MSQHKASQNIIVTGFLLVILVLVTITGIGLSRIQHFSATVHGITDDRAEQINRMRLMREAAQERSVILQSLIIANDRFGVEDELERLLAATSQYANARRELLTFDHEPAVADLLERQHAIAVEVGGAQQGIIMLLRDGKTEQAGRQLFLHVLPESYRSMALMDRFIERRRDENIADMERLHASIRQTSTLMLVLSLAGVLFIIGVATTIQRRTRAEVQRRELSEQGLRQTELRERTILENIADGLLTVDTRGTILSANRAAVALFGHEEGALSGRGIGELLPEVFQDAESVHLSYRLAEWAHRMAGVGHEITAHRRDGGTFAAELDISRFELGTESNYILLVRDITERKAGEERLQRFNQELEQRVAERTRELAHANEQLTHLATHDPLTGLPNRALFNEQLDNRLQQSVRHRRRMALLFLDLDGFKGVNDSHGHAVGDQLLQAVADRMKGCLRTEDVLARVGGDEFAVILGDLGESIGAARVADKLVQAVRRPFTIDGHTCRIGTSIGISLYPEHTDVAAELLHMADEAMYAAKQGGKDIYLFATRQPVQSPSGSSSA